MVQEQINLRLPQNLEEAAQKYIELYGFKNMQELIAEALREKLFMKVEYDESFTEKEINLIDELIEKTIKGKHLKAEAEFRQALR